MQESLQTIDLFGGLKKNLNKFFQIFKK